MGRLRPPPYVARWVDEHELVTILGFTFVGVRTGRFAELRRSYRDVLSMPMIKDESQAAWFVSPPGDEVHVYGPDDVDQRFFSQGPVVGLQVDDSPRRAPPWSARVSASSVSHRPTVARSGTTTAAPMATCTGSGSGLRVPDPRLPGALRVADAVPSGQLAALPATATAAPS
jgi:hypothetical protein